MSGPHRRFAARAEIMKLARLLELELAEVGYLEEVAADDLRRLREQVTEVIYDSGSHALGRLASASRLLPTSAVALIGEHAFGPMLAARIAGLLDPGRAADVAAKLPTPFLAEVATHLDPRRAAEVLRRMPPARIAEVARELTSSEEHVTLGRFAGHLPDEALALALSEMDDLTVLRVAFVLEDSEGIDRTLALLDRGRLEGLLDAAVGTELWPEVLELFAGAPEPLRSRVLGTRVA